LASGNWRSSEGDDDGGGWVTPRGSERAERRRSKISNTWGLKYPLVSDRHKLFVIGGKAGFSIRKSSESLPITMIRNFGNVISSPEHYIFYL
jgi:hypothetical protein